MPDNFLTNSSLDRMGPNRNDGDWIENELRSASTIFYTIVDLKIAIQNLDVNPSLAKLPSNRATDLLHRGAETVFLGHKDGSSIFSIETEQQLHVQNAQYTDLRPVAPLLSADEAGLFAYARAMSFWHKTHKYCGACGSQTLSQNGGHQRVCLKQSCPTHALFPRTDPAVIMLVEKDNQCLLGHQRTWANNTYSTLAGFVEPGESLEQAVAREVFEESGVRVENILYHSSQPWPFPSSVMLGFTATAITENITLTDDELADARWFTRDQLIQGVLQGSLGLPTPFSIAHRLIMDWFEEEPGYSASDFRQP